MWMVCCFAWKDRPVSCMCSGLCLISFPLFYHGQEKAHRGITFLILLPKFFPPFGHGVQFVFLRRSPTFGWRQFFGFFFLHTFGLFRIISLACEVQMFSQKKEKRIPNFQEIKLVFNRVLSNWFFSKFNLWHNYFYRFQSESFLETCKNNSYQRKFYNRKCYTMNELVMTKLYTT